MSTFCLNVYNWQIIKLAAHKLLTLLSHKFIEKSKNEAIIEQQIGL